MATLFDNLISHKDILDKVLYEFIDTEDLVNLDSAVVNTDARKKFHEAVANTRYKVPFESNPDIWLKHHKDILAWLTACKMYHSEGTWRVNHKLWTFLVEDPQYHDLLRGMRGIFFEDFGEESALQGLDICVNLRRLEIRNFTSPAKNSTSLNLLNLEELFLQNTMINEDLMSIFGNTPKLHSIHLHHAKFPADAETTATDAAATTFIHKFTTLKVVGGMLVSDLKQLIRGPTRLQNVTIDALHKADPNPTDLHDFLQNIPDVRTLSVDRTRLNIESFFKCLTAFNPKLRSLHLNHIRLMESPTTVPSDRIDLAISALQISTLLPGTADDVMSILKHTRSTSSLILSFLSKVDIEGYARIKGIGKYHSVEIHAAKENLSGVEGTVDTLKQIFADTPAFKLVEWPEWKAEKEKTLYPEQATVLVSRSL